MPNTNLAGLKATEEGLREAFPDTGEISSIIPMIEKGSAPSLATILARSLRLKHPPTAIVTTKS